MPITLLGAWRALYPTQGQRTEVLGCSEPEQALARDLRLREPRKRLGKHLLTIFRLSG